MVKVFRFEPQRSLQQRLVEKQGSLQLCVERVEVCSHDGVRKRFVEQG